MLVELLQVVDRLVLLARGRIDRRKQLFEQIFKGVFDDLLLVHGDYLALFAAVRKLAIADELTALDNAQGALRDMRIKFAPVRERLRQFAAAFDTSALPPEEQAFQHAVIWYFPSGVLVRNSTSATQIIDAVEALNDVGLELLDESDKISHLIGLLETHRDRQVDAWSEVCASYARLKIKIATI